MPTLLAVPTQCPKCGSQGLWDNRLTKTNPKAPAFKCKNKACDGVVWEPRKGEVWADQIVQQPAVQPAIIGAHIPAIDGPALTHENMKIDALNNLMGAYDLCFSHAQQLARRTGADTVVTLEGISAITATIFIAAKDKGLV